LEEFCKIIKKKIVAGVYEPSNASYRSKFFGVVKKDGKSIRLVHALEPLNAVTIAHSGVPPATDELANHFAGRACGGSLDLYSGYDHRDIVEGSRDFTTFQTPFGALRLVKLPQGWMNSVPIFHDDVTYETIPENKGIRRFVWEHLQNVNRIVQGLKYCGGTFSGAKSIICWDTFPVVGHICSYEGRRLSVDRIGVIIRWGPLKDVSGVRQFLGTIGVLHMFIKDYGKLAQPIAKLVQGDQEFVWDKEQEDAMKKLKQAIADSPALRPLNYDIDTDIVLSTDICFSSTANKARHLESWWWGLQETTRATLPHQSQPRRVQDYPPAPSPCGSIAHPRLCVSVHAHLGPARSRRRVRRQTSPASVCTSRCTFLIFRPP
jgi:hypothetical protein